MDLLCLVNICTVKYLIINKPEYARRELKVCKRMERSSFTSLCRFLSATVQRATVRFGERETVTGQNPGGGIFSCPDRQWDGIGMMIRFTFCGGICGKGPIDPNDLIQTHRQNTAEKKNLLHVVNDIFQNRTCRSPESMFTLQR